MSILKQKSSTVFPDLEKITDPEIKQVLSDLFKVLQGSLTDSYDDANAIVQWEVDGTETQLVTADEVDMQSKKIINVTDPTAAQDASTKTYTDTKISKTTAAEISAMTEKTSLADGDHFLIEDSAASNAKKRVQKSNIASDKISKTTAGEIAAMTEKTTLVDADLFLIEDSAAGNAKKKVQKSNISPVSTFMPTDIQVFTANGTWIKPANISKVYVKVVGGGGAGGAATGSYGESAGGGGGGGGYSEGYVVVSGNVTVTVGTAGNLSSFAGDTTVQGNGGSAGAAGSSGGAGGGGGTGTGGQINITGGTGGTGAIQSAVSNTRASGGTGGGSILGSGGGSNAAGGGYGGGGGGNSGAGAGGLVIVYY